LELVIDTEGWLDGWDEVGAIEKFFGFSLFTKFSENAFPPLPSKSCATSRLCIELLRFKLDRGPPWPFTLEAIVDRPEIIVGILENAFL
jgi:hypothetical protein